MNNAANRPGPALPWLAGGALLAGVLVLGGAYRHLPLDPVAATFASGAVVSDSLPDFTLTNQDGQTITKSSLLGHTWIADIIFTRCAGPCPKITRQMSELQRAFAGDDRVRLLTLTTDPVYDTTARLMRYGERFGAQAARWWFLTGTKAQIHRLAVEGLKLAALETEPADRQAGADLFIHSTQFVLIDPEGRVRGYFDGTAPEVTDQVRQALKTLIHAANRATAAD